MREILTRWSRLVFLFLPLLLASYLPARADQRVSVFDGAGDGDGILVDPTRPEGDPLDTNDVGDGDDPDSHYDHSDGARVPSAVRPFVIGGKQIFLIPVSQGGVLTFKILLVDLKVASGEG